MREDNAAASDSVPVYVAIGDIHGCNDLLRQLLDKISRRMVDQPHQLVFLGDYVDRGADSRGVLDTLLALQKDRPDTVFLRGNHEEAMLDFLGAPEEAEEWLSWGGEQTLSSYGVPVNLPIDLQKVQQAFANALPDEHFRFLMGLPTIHQIKDYIFVHAGLNPKRDLETQRDKDLLWIRDAFYQAGAEAFPGMTIVHGHTPVKKPEDHRWRINVDTGAVWSQKLSAVVLGQDSPSFITT